MGEIGLIRKKIGKVEFDRLLHRSTVINIRGESYRLKEKRQAKNSTPGIEVTQNM